jgi:hypothetical protein
VDWTYSMFASVYKDDNTGDNKYLEKELRKELEKENPSSNNIIIAF